MFRVKFWGVRGSIPLPGPNTIKFGGNTSCVEVDCGSEIVIIDGGTGLRPLGLDLIQRGAITNGRTLSIFFSHVHWDHIQGFPFFRPAFMPDVRINLYGSKHSDIDIETSLRGQMVAPHFPLRLRDMPSKISFKGIGMDETIQAGPATVTSVELVHPNGAIGYRVACEGKSIVYFSDHEDPDAPDQRLMDFAQGADILIYDAMYTPDEYSGADGGGGRKGWGHSTWKKGTDFARRADIKQLILFHHGRADDQITKIEALAREEFPNTTAAYEGLEIRLA